MDKKPDTILFRLTIGIIGHGGKIEKVDTLRLVHPTSLLHLYISH